MLRQAGTEQGLNAEQGRAVEVCGGEPVHPSRGKPELAGRRGGRDFSKLAYLASKVNANLRSS